MIYEFLCHLKRALPQRGNLSVRIEIELSWFPSNCHIYTAVNLVCAAFIFHRNAQESILVSEFFAQQCIKKEAPMQCSCSSFGHRIPLPGQKACIPECCLSLQAHAHFLCSLFSEGQLLSQQISPDNPLRVIPVSKVQPDPRPPRPRSTHFCGSAEEAVGLSL